MIDSVGHIWSSNQSRKSIFQRTYTPIMSGPSDALSDGPQALDEAGLAAVGALFGEPRHV